LEVILPTYHRKLWGVKTESLGQAKSAQKVVFHCVAENLYHWEQSGVYYALLKRADKQFRRSQRTKDPELAERRLVELRAQVDTLTTLAEDIEELARPVRPGQLLAIQPEGAAVRQRLPAVEGKSGQKSAHLGRHKFSVGAPVTMLVLLSTR